MWYSLLVSIHNQQRQVGPGGAAAASRPRHGLEVKDEELLKKWI
jgi:hypothetical protein